VATFGVARGQLRSDRPLQAVCRQLSVRTRLHSGFAAWCRSGYRPSAAILRWERKFVSIDRVNRRFCRFCLAPLIPVCGAADHPLRIVSEEVNMWRAFFLSLGIFVFIIGAECLAVEKFVLKKRQETVVGAAFNMSSAPGPNKVFTPPAWAPWSLMSTGAVVCLYCFTVPRLVNS
jgi:hypothetical protein